ncbi:MAG: sugar ABC transporter substrate-binding protein [Treponema sp.]|jgi:inositol transport system substrate-binding protein|nr:sugar ABC transporter substrate-binding protein [Treponema sp.]
MKKWIMRCVIFCCVVAVMAVFVGCKKSEGKKVFKVGYVNNSDSLLFNKITKDEFDKLAKNDVSIEVVFSNANSDIQLQLDQIDNFVARKVDVIITAPIDYDGIVPGIEKANEANIPILSLGTEAGGGDFIFIGTVYYQDGEMQGKYMAEHLPKDADILYLSCVPGQSYSRERRQAFLDIMESRPDVTILAEQTGMDQRANGMQIMEDWLQAFPKIDAVIAANDPMALGAIEAMKGAGRLSGVLVAGVDAIPEALTAIKNGEMAMTVFQSAPALAKAAFDVVKKLQNGETVERRVLIPNELVTVDNVDQISGN